MSFIVKRYNKSDRPIIKGHGFDGLEIGEDREEAQEFIDFVNCWEKELEEMATSAKKNLLRALKLRKFLEEKCAYVEKYDPKTGEQEILSITDPEGFEIHMQNNRRKEQKEQ